MKDKDTEMKSFCPKCGAEMIFTEEKIKLKTSLLEKGKEMGNKRTFHCPECKRREIKIKKHP